MAKVIVSRQALEALASKVLQDRIDGIMIKNADYGDAWQANGPFNPVMRIKEKLTRVETLSDGREALVLDESIESNIGEIFDYTLLYMLYRERNKIILVPGQLSFEDFTAAIDAAREDLHETPYLFAGLDVASGHPSIGYISSVPATGADPDTGAASSDGGAANSDRTASGANTDQPTATDRDASTPNKDASTPNKDASATDGDVDPWAWYDGDANSA